ncbi:MAG: hypothetical protein E7254_11415 [Lachnospiraceae bacterium]|nr:hypothetical protein [Lachnospiraceae bacterium]
MKEYIRRTAIKYKNRPYLFVLWGIFLPLIVCSGIIAPMFLIFIMAILSAMVDKSHVKYIVPRPAQDIKKDGIENILGWTLCSLILMSLSMCFEYLVYKDIFVGLEDNLMQAIYYIGFVSVVFSVLTSSEIKFEKNVVKGKLKFIDYFELSIIILIVGSYWMIPVLSSLDENRFVNHYGCGIKVVILILSACIVLAGIYRIINWKIEDFNG